MQNLKTKAITMKMYSMAQNGDYEPTMTCTVQSCQGFPLWVGMEVLIKLVTLDLLSSEGKRKRRSSNGMHR